MRILRGMLVSAVAAALLVGATSAAAQGLADDAGAAWRLEQPAPPPPEPGVPEAPAPIGLGRIGDIEFAPGMPNRGALITAGNPPTIPAGVWEFNGVSWHELSTVCGASDGRIVWAGPEEFWTISDGRPGQASGGEGRIPPTRDNTLCRFSNPGHKGEPLRVMESFAAPAFEVDSYQAMNAGGCLNANDCWFAGEPLPPEGVETGSFHVHWNGSALGEAPYPAEGHPVESMQRFEGRLYESARIAQGDRVETQEEPAPLHVINPEGAANVFEGVRELPLYEPEEFPTALDFLHLSAGEESLWAAAGAQTTPAGSKPGQVTIVRHPAGGGWRQILGPEKTAESGKEPFPGETISAIAAEPGNESAWIGLDAPQDYRAASGPGGEEPSTTAFAKVARVAPNGAISSEDSQTLPSEPGVGPKGAAFVLSCPGPHDCWLATTHGWLFHLSNPQERSEKEQGLTLDGDQAFETLIVERPPDKGLPVVVPDTLPPDDSGLLGELTTPPPSSLEVFSHKEESRIQVPLLSHVHSRLVHGSTLELRFHLAVRAHIKLVAQRKKRVVASTPMHTFAAGNRSLQLRLDPKRWPTKLEFQTHALAPLPTVSLNQSNETTVSTSLRFPHAGGALSGLLP